MTINGFYFKPIIIHHRFCCQLNPHSIPLFSGLPTFNPHIHSKAIVNHLEKSTINGYIRYIYIHIWYNMVQPTKCRVVYRFTDTLLKRLMVRDPHLGSWGTCCMVRPAAEARSCLTRSDVTGMMVNYCG